MNEKLQLIPNLQYANLHIFFDISIDFQHFQRVFILTHSDSAIQGKIAQSMSSELQICEFVL